MGELEDLFSKHAGRMVTKWRHYFEIYERHFAPFRGKPVVLLEIGVWHGGSLQLWRRYLGPLARIVGVDVRPECSAFAEAGTDIVIGDQADPATHRRLRDTYGAFDLVIDDGGHTMAQQVTTFREIFPAVREAGVYVVEDTHSSYHPHWGGGLRVPGTFIEQAKLMIDQLHAHYGFAPELAQDLVTHAVHGLHFYDSMVVVEKRQRASPQAVYRGTPTLAMSAEEQRFVDSMGREGGPR